MTRHGYKFPDYWRHVKLKVQPDGRLQPVHMISGTGFGLGALKAFGIPPQPTAFLDEPAALKLGALLEERLELHNQQQLKARRR